MTVERDEYKGSAQHITLRLERDIVVALKQRADRNDRSVSAEARLALRQYLGLEAQAA